MERKENERKGSSQGKKAEKVRKDSTKGTKKENM